VVAGACFILPATLIVTAMAWSYVRYGTYPMVGAALLAIKPVILAVVVQAVWSLGRTSVKSARLALLGGAALTANLLGVGELTVLALTGALAGIAHSLGRKPHGGMALLGSALPPAAVALAAFGPVGAGSAVVSIWEMFVVFLKIGSVLFGSGYVLLAFLRRDFVERLGWLTEGQLLDAVAVGQFTPGPVFTTATFIGFVLGGFSGATLATVAIFLPAFVFVAISGPLVPRLRQSALAGAVLDGLVVASLAVMASVTLTLARVAIVDWRTAGLAVLAAFLLLRFQVNSAWLVLGAGALGLVMPGAR
jgi:chromate transporter